MGANYDAVHFISIAMFCRWYCALEQVASVAIRIFKCYVLVHVLRVPVYEQNLAS